MIPDYQKITSSNVRSERFKECCSFLKLTPLRMIYDVVTRWDSAYKMLSRAFYLRKAIDHFVAEDNKLAKFKLTKKEWDQAAVILTILFGTRINWTDVQLKLTMKKSSSNVNTSPRASPIGYVHVALLPLFFKKKGNLPIRQNPQVAMLL